MNAMLNTLIPFDLACAQLEAAKIAEARARDARIDAETAVLAHIEARDEGSVTLRGLGWKATAVYGMNRTIDEAALDTIRGTVPEAIFGQVFKYKPEVSVTGLRYVRNNEPELYAVIAQAITAKPAKASVRIEMTDFAGGAQ